MAGRREIRKRIEEYFSSRDREMKKLGQRLCHIHRVSYWMGTVYDIDRFNHSEDEKIPEMARDYSLKKLQKYSKSDIQILNKYLIRHYIRVVRINLKKHETIRTK